MATNLDTAGILGLASITASDTTRLDKAYTGLRAVWIGTAGNLAVDCGQGAVTIPNVPVGILPIPGLQKVMATNTTASNLLIIW